MNASSRRRGMDEVSSSDGPAAVGGNFTDCRNSRPWGDLLNVILADIFSRLPFEEKLQVVPQVCKSWQEASYDSTCWAVVDMQPWILKKTDMDLEWEFECEEKMDYLVKTVVDRSCGHLRELRTMYISDSTIDYIAGRCPALEILSIANSPMVTDSSALNLAPQVPKLKQLDLSDCQNLSKQTLEEFGRNCPSLTWLGRNMIHLQCTDQWPGAATANSVFECTLPSSPGGDDEAEAISKHLGRLKHLEMKRSRLSDRGLRHLVRGCRQLETLDLACCMSISPQALEAASRDSPTLKNFRKPIIPRMHISFNHNISTLWFDD